MHWIQQTILPGNWWCSATFNHRKTFTNEGLWLMILSSFFLASMIVCNWKVSALFQDEITTHEGRTVTRIFSPGHKQGRIETRSLWDFERPRQDGEKFSPCHLLWNTEPALCPIKETRRADVSYNRPRPVSPLLTPHSRHTGATQAAAAARPRWASCQLLKLSTHFWTLGIKKAFWHQKVIMVQVIKRQSSNSLSIKTLSLLLCPVISRVVKFTKPRWELGFKYLSVYQCVTFTVYQEILVSFPSDIWR